MSLGHNQIYKICPHKYVNGKKHMKVLIVKSESVLVKLDLVNIKAEEMELICVKWEIYLSPLSTPIGALFWCKNTVESHIITYMCN